MAGSCLLGSPVVPDILRSGSKSPGLVEWYFNDVLFDDLPLWDSHVLLWGPFAAESRERATPGQRQRTPKCCLHGLPARDLPPLPHLSLQTFDALEKMRRLRNYGKDSLVQCFPNLQCLLIKLQIYCIDL